MKIENRLPSKRLLEFCQKNAEKIAAISYYKGFNTPTEMAYDVLIAPGWSIDRYGEHMHTIIEPKSSEVIRLLKTAEHCGCDKADCCCCQG